MRFIRAENSDSSSDIICQNQSEMHGNGRKPYMLIARGSGLRTWDVAAASDMWEKLRRVCHWRPPLIARRSTGRLASETDSSLRFKHERACMNIGGKCRLYLHARPCVHDAPQMDVERRFAHPAFQIMLQLSEALPQSFSSKIWNPSGHQHRLCVTFESDKEQD